MKTTHILAGALLLAACAAGCSPTRYASTGSAYDDLYATHDRTAISQRKQAEAESRRARAEAAQAEWEARMAEARARAAEEEYYDNAADIVADSYESAYARRMRGFRSAEYRMPSNYYALRYENSGAFMFASAYDPAFYNIMVSGDQVWVEPKYITSMFGSWGATPYYGGWYFGWNHPSFGWGYPSFGWGYPHHPWWGWNWSIGYWPWHDHWWGHPVPPHYHPGGGSHPRPNRPDIVHRPGFTSPATNRNFGTQAPAGRGSNSSFGVRNPQGGGSVRPGQSTGRPSGNGTSRGGSMNRSNRGGTTTFDRGSSNSTFNRGGSPTYNPGSTPSYNRGGGSFTPPSGRNAGGR